VRASESERESRPPGPAPSDPIYNYWTKDEYMLNGRTPVLLCRFDILQVNITPRKRALSSVKLVLESGKPKKPNDKV